MTERTLIIFKPDAVQRGLVGEILARFERVGLKIVGAKMLQPDDAHYHHHYEGIGSMISRRGEEAFKVTLELMQRGPVIAVVFEGVEAIAVGRKLVGETEPKNAAPGTIRGDYSHMSRPYSDTQQIGIPNLVHASGDPKEAEAEIAHWFNKAELFEYEAVHEPFTQTRSSHIKPK